MMTVSVVVMAVLVESGAGGEAWRGGEGAEAVSGGGVLGKTVIPMRKSSGGGS